MLAVGWPVTFATDIAVSYFIARIIFRLHPAIPFLLLLGIASDALAFLALAVVHPGGDTNLPLGAAIMAVALGGRLRRCGGCATGASGCTCSPPASSRGRRST